MDNITYKLATEHDASFVKDLINEMYGTEYEVRPNEEIAKAIKNQTEIYFLAFCNSKCFGFSGASLNNDYYKDIITPDIAVIDYIYLTQYNNEISTSFQLISCLFNRLIEINVKSAIMQVQTSNKQRFLHYALSDKNIIKSEPIEQHGKQFEDQILLIKDLKDVSTLSMKDIMKKAYYFRKNENLMI